MNVDGSALNSPEGASRSSIGEVASARRIGSGYIGPKHVAIVCHTDRFFLTHRSMWASALCASGSRVTVIAPDTGLAEAIRGLGVDFKSIPSTTEASSTLSLLATTGILLGRLVTTRPTVVLLNSQLLYTLGCFYAILSPRARVIRVVGGVGRALADNSDFPLKSQVIRITGRLFSAFRNVFTLFQTEHDREVFRNFRMTSSGRDSVIPGSGIDVASWPEWNDDKIQNRQILFASRLTAEKGVLEFLEAARSLQHSGWEFAIAGEPDMRVSSAVSSDELARRAAEANVKVLGHVPDLAGLLSRVALLVFPTRHPEGTPRVLIEAAASATACIATSEPGCLAVVEDGVTGTLIGRAPTPALVADAIAELTEAPGKLKEMGIMARRNAQDKFDMSITIRAFLQWSPVGAEMRKTVGSEVQITEPR